MPAQFSAMQEKLCGQVGSSIKQLRTESGSFDIN